MAECTRIECKVAEDFNQLCDTCISEFETWIEETSYPEFDVEAWALDLAMQGLDNNESVEDWGDTRLDTWTLNERNSDLEDNPEKFVISELEDAIRYLSKDAESAWDKQNNIKLAENSIKTAVRFLDIAKSQAKREYERSIEKQIDDIQMSQ